MLYRLRCSIIHKQFLLLPTMLPTSKSKRKRQLSLASRPAIADGGTTRVTSVSSAKSATKVAASVLFCAAAALLCFDFDYFDSKNASLRGVAVVNSRLAADGHNSRRQNIKKVRRYLAEKKSAAKQSDEDDAADEDESDNDGSEDDAGKDDDDGFDDDEVGDDDYIEEILEHDALFDQVVDHLYAAYTAGTSPGYLETFAEHGWGFAGIDGIANDWGLRDQVRAIAYPEKFTCATLDAETEKPKIKLTEEDEEEEKRCHTRLMPLLNVIDDVVVLPDMMFRYKQSIMDRFNQLHSAVKKKLDEDQRKEAIRKAQEARDAAKQEQQQEEMAQMKGDVNSQVVSANDGEVVNV